MTAKHLCLATALVSGLVLSACGSGGADGPGSVSVDEAKALDEAAEMLEERRLPEGALPPVASPESEVQEAAQEELAK